MSYQHSTPGWGLYDSAGFIAVALWYNPRSACRNAMMGASFQASIAALFFNELLDILVSPTKLRTLQVGLDL